MRGSLTALGLALSLVALVAAGCGGGDETTSTEGAVASSSTTPGPALSDQDFASQGNAICEQGDQDINAEAQKIFSGGKPTQQDQLGFVTDTVIPGIQSQIDGIRALTPPEDIQQDVTQTLDDAQNALDQAKADPSLLTDQANTDVFSEVNKELRAVGLDKCGSD